MINNNLDYEKNSNTTAAAASATTQLSTTTTAAKMNNSNNSNKTTATTITTKPNNTTNDNNYFNRFDNRIAANLAAVLTGSRFRSSSCSNSNSNNSNRNRSGSMKNDNANATKANATPARRAMSRNYNCVATLTRSKQMQQQQLNNKADMGNTMRISSPTPSMLYLNTSNYNLNASNGGGIGSMGRRRPLNLFSQSNLNCNDNEKVAVQTPSSDEDNSPTELNNCKRLTDKPPLVKRLTMGLLRTNEESRPLVSNATPITTNSTAGTCTNTDTLKVKAGNNPIYSNGYINDEAFEPEKFIDSKFGDSCRQSLTAIPMLDNLNLNDNSEFNLKKRYLRETSSANSSPKIFANRLRVNNVASRYNATNSGISNNTTGSSSSSDEEEAELKDASWYQAGISRDIAVEILNSKSPGAFLVRKSTSKPGCYALTLRVPSPPGPKTANYIILRTSGGYKIKGFRKEFTSLKALITHHSVMPELLPVPLAMPRPTNISSSRRNLDDFDTYDSLQMLLKYLRAKNMENE